MPKIRNQLNVRLSDEGREVLESLVAHFTRVTETGRPATQGAVVERALRALAAREKLSRNS